MNFDVHYYSARNGDQFYRTYAVSRWVVWQHGEIGSVGQFRIMEFRTSAEAHERAQYRMEEMRRTFPEKHRTGRFLTGDWVASDLGCRRLYQAYLEATKQAGPTVAPPKETLTLSSFADRAAEAIRVAATDPKKGRQLYLQLSGDWERLQGQFREVQSHVKTLETVLMGAE